VVNSGPAGKGGRNINWMERVERFWRKIFEGLFRGGEGPSLQPVEIAKKLLKTMQSRRTISVSRIYVPNVYTVYLSPKDFENLAPFEKSLCQELAQYLSQKAQDQRFSMVGPVRVSMELEEELPPGEVRIYARMEEAAEPESAGDWEDHTVMYAKEESLGGRRPSYRLQVVSGPDSGRVFPLESGRQILGRHPSCDFVLTDEQVSRRHCQLEEVHDRWFLVDLGSRNGTLVNGEPVERVFLQPGDRIQLGRTVIEFQIGE